MSLTELNNEIKRLAPIANQRINRLKNSKQKGADTGMLYLQKLAGESMPSNASPSTGLAKTFSTKKESNANKGRARVSALVKGLKSKRSTKTGLIESDEQRKKTLSKMMFAPYKEMKKVRVYDEPKTGDPKKDKKRKYHYEMRERTTQKMLTTAEYGSLIRTLNWAQTYLGAGKYDSDQILNLYSKETIDKKFTSYADFEKYLREKLPQGDAEFQYDSLKDGNKYVKDFITGQWVVKYDWSIKL